MEPRSPTETHRVSTPLELLFDLVFVVAINFTAAAFHHDLSAGHIRHGVIDFGIVFFAIWLAWLNFTWFASAYDVDDVPYRIAVFVQMSGAIIFAAGVTRAFEEREFQVCIAGYVVMRLALVSQWLRAAYSGPAHRQTALRYAAGVFAVQLGWVYFGFVLDQFSFPLFFSLAALDLVVPAWAERAGATTWHPHHIAERYGLFTIIVLGEAVFALATAIQQLVEGDHLTAHYLALPLGGAVILYAMWWVYFDYHAPELLVSTRNVFFWGYGHAILWAAIAATGVGIEVCVDYAMHHAELTQLQAQFALAIPAALFLVSLWLFHDFTHAASTLRRFATPAAALLVLLTPWLDYAPVWIAAILVGLLIVRGSIADPFALATHS